MGASPFIGEIMIFAGNFAPKGWAFCNGQLLPISQNTALYSLLGTTYGGNGQTTFALPDLRSRMPNHAGQGLGLSSYVLGQSGGTENHTLLTTEMPSHTHNLAARNDAGNSTAAAGNIFAKEATGQTSVYSNQLPNAAMASGAIAPAGGSQPFSIQPPYLTLNYCIALEGIFPSRN